MLTQYRMTFSTESGSRPCPEWGYRLYETMLERATALAGTDIPKNAPAPVSQYLNILNGGKLMWTVSLLGDTAEEALGSAFENASWIYLDQERAFLRVLGFRRRSIENTDTLFELAERCDGIHRLRFCTPTAFKSRKQYVNLPSRRLILQSLIQKWNACISDSPIEDEDGRGAEAVAAGLRVRKFSLHDGSFRLQDSTIPGFIGEMTLENCLSGFQRTMADVLLIFSEYAGIGIKTTLGMGGVMRLNTQTSSGTQQRKGTGR